MKHMLSVVFVVILAISGVSTGALRGSTDASTITGVDGSEYWALIVGCNEFLNNEGMNLPGNDKAAEDFCELLLVSDHWYPDHIRLLTGKNASSLNILQGLRWLDRMDDEDDVCVFYISTHGGPVVDLPPIDEDDGYDEALETYSTHRLYNPRTGMSFCIPWIAYLWDDEINMLLNMLDAQGICFIVNTCYSGGFADHFSYPYTEPASASRWMTDFAVECRGAGRVVLMACEEDRLSNGNFFPYYLMEGLQGCGDVNTDAVCSAEEAFAYAAPKTAHILQQEYEFFIQPQLYDDYPGDLILTTGDLPPSPTCYSNGPLVGSIDTLHTYVFYATDPENHRIRYHFDWGDDSEEWTPLVPSDELLSIAHSWDTEGTYNILLRNEDEHGMWFYHDSFPRTRLVVTMEDDHVVDQRQTELFEGLSLNDGIFMNNHWCAQSFISTRDTLSQVELEVLAKGTDIAPVTVSIRENLVGEDLTNVSVLLDASDIYTPTLTWTIFDFPDIQVTPGIPYYIVCRVENRTSSSLYGWTYAGSLYEDPYGQGHAFISKNSGRSWSECSTIHDFSFVTYTQ